MLYFKIDCNSLIKISMLNFISYMPPSLHQTRYTSEYIIYIILDGELHLINNGEKMSLKKGDVRIFAKGDFQKPYESTKCRYCYIHFDGCGISLADMNDEEYASLIYKQKIAFLNSNIYSNDCYGFSEIVLPSQFSISDSLLEYAVREFNKNKLDSNTLKVMNYKIAVSRNTMEILSEFYDFLSQNCAKRFSVSESSYSVVKNIISYVDSNYFLDFTSKDLENLLAVNFDYANRIFKTLTGNTIFSYRRNLRINAAKTLIATSCKNMTEIAEAVGFCDVYYFSRIFKKVTGTTPTEYSKIVLKEVTVV